MVPGIVEVHLPLLVWTAWPVGFVCLFTLLCQDLLSSILGSENMVATVAHLYNTASARSTI